MRKLLAALLLTTALAGQASGQSASLLPNGMQQFADQNGAPYVNGKVFFYVPNTTTPKETWQDPGEATPNTNPVVLDGAGRATIYGSGQYRQQLYDQFGALIWDKLTYGPPGPPGGGGGTQVLSMPSNCVADFNADPTGLTDSTAALNSCLAQQCFAFIPAGSYLTTDTVTTGNCRNITVVGAGSSLVKITINSNSKSVFQGAPALYDGYFSGMTVDRTGTAVAGAYGWNFGSATNQLQLVDLVAIDQWQGFWLGVTAWSWAKNIVAAQNYADGIYMSNSLISCGMDWNLDGVISQQNNGMGIYAEGIDNGQANPCAVQMGPWNNITTANNGNAGILVWSNNAGLAVEGFHLTNSSIAGDGNDEIKLSTTAENPIIISNTAVALAGTAPTGRNQSIPASNNGNGINIVGINGQVSLINDSVEGNSLDGILAGGTINQLQVVGVWAELNGASTPGATYHGLDVATTPNSTLITNGFFGNRSGGSSQAYGIGIASGTGVTLTGSAISGNSVGGITVGSNASAIYCFGLQGVNMGALGCNQGTGSGGGGVTLNAGANMVLTPNPILSTGTIAVASAPTFSGLVTANGNLSVENGGYVNWPGDGNIRGSQTGNLEITPTTDTVFGGTAVVPAAAGTQTIGIPGQGWGSIYMGGGSTLYLGGTTTVSITTDGNSIKVATPAGAGLIPTTDNTDLLGSGGARWTAVYATNGAIQTSDGRDKESVRPSDLGLDFIESLRPISFVWKSGQDKKRHYGLIAQELNQALEGREFGGLHVPEDEHDRYGLNYSELIPPLIKSVQEMELENVELRAENSLLARRLAILEQTVSTKMARSASVGHR